MGGVATRDLIMLSLCPQCGRITLSFIDQKAENRPVLARVAGGGEYFDRALTQRRKEYGDKPGWELVESVCLPHEFHFTFYCEHRPLTDGILAHWRRSDKHYDTRHGSVQYAEVDDQRMAMQGKTLVRSCHQCGPPIERPFVEVIELERRMHPIPPSRATF
jgi:hypothetical protein